MGNVAGKYSHGVTVQLYTREAEERGRRINGRKSLGVAESRSPGVEKWEKSNKAPKRGEGGYVKRNSK